MHQQHCNGPLALAVQAYDDLEHFETPFVVKLHRFNTLANTQVACQPLVHVQGRFVAHLSAVKLYRSRGLLSETP